jgi:hypothetical protein
VDEEGQMSNLSVETAGGVSQQQEAKAVEEGLLPSESMLEAVDAYFGSDYQHRDFIIEELSQQLEPNSASPDRLPDGSFGSLDNLWPNSARVRAVWQQDGCTLTDFHTLPIDDVQRELPESTQPFGYPDFVEQGYHSQLSSDTSQATSAQDHQLIREDSQMTPVHRSIFYLQDFENSFSLIERSRSGEWQAASRMDVDDLAYFFTQAHSGVTEDPQGHQGPQNYGTAHYLSSGGSGWSNRVYLPGYTNEPSCNPPEEYTEDTCNDLPECYGSEPAIAPEPTTLRDVEDQRLLRGHSV